MTLWYISIVWLLVLTAWLVRLERRHRKTATKPKMFGHDFDRKRR